MKQMVCEMCGSTDLIKQDGVFVCQTCGTKYSIEEAKKMMIEGNVDVSGSTVKVDNTDNIDNYLNIARNAYGANNKAEAELYCNKILEIDNNHYAAWLLKGKAAGWQSTIASLRIDEAINCFTKAVDNAPADKLEEVKKEAASETTSLTSALITMCCKNFANYPSKDNADNVVGAALLMKRISIQLLLKCGTKTDDVSASLASIINNSAINAWENKVWPDYGGAANHPSKYAWEHFIEQGDAVILMLKTAVDICDTDDATDAVRYSNMISVMTKLCDSASYKYDPTWRWQIEYQLDETAKSSRNKMILEWHKAWNKIDSTHVVPSAETVSQASNRTATNEANENACICIAVIVIVTIVIIMGIMS